MLPQAPPHLPCRCPLQAMARHAAAWLPPRVTIVQNPLLPCSLISTTPPLPLPPAGMDEAPGGMLDSLLAGQDNFCFGNPCAQFFQGLQQGQLHPKVSQYRELVEVSAGVPDVCSTGSWWR
jgi:hypothetical protein